MTFSELLLALEYRLPAIILNGDVATTLDAARKGTHKHALAGTVVASLFEKNAIAGIDAAITRSQAIAALAPIRLEYMKDDAPVEGFRLVEKIVHAIDGAFNDEALRIKAKEKPQ